MGRKKNRGGVVYSTNSSYDYNSNDDEETLSIDEQLLYVSLDSKKRKGKTVTLVEGFVGSKDDLNALGKLLKSKCGVGGTAKDGEIIVQGNLKQKVADILTKEGYSIKLKGGG